MFCVDREVVRVQEVMDALPSAITDIITGLLHTLLHTHSVWGTDTSTHAPQLAAIHPGPSLPPSHTASQVCAYVCVCIHLYIHVCIPCTLCSLPPAELASPGAFHRLKLGMLLSLASCASRQPLHLLVVATDTTLLPSLLLYGSSLSSRSTHHTSTSDLWGTMR